MKVEIKVPPMGESVVDATVSHFLKEEGSMVKMDEEVVELETDKVNQVLYAPQSGKITWSVKVGDRVVIDQVIGFVDTDAKPSSQETTPQPLSAKDEAPLPPSIETPKNGTSARKMAPEFVAEVSKKTEKVAPPPSSPPPSPPPKPKKESAPKEGVTRKRMSKLRQVIAERLVDVKNTTAMLTTFNEIDMSAVMAIRAKEKESFMERYGVRLGFMSFFVKAVVAALKAYSQVNAMIEEDEILLFSTYDIGIAIAAEKGLLVPVVKGCDALSFGGIEGAIQGFAKKAKEGTISVDDLKGGSFTITNGGTFGSLLSTPILNPPQSAILGMHSIVKRAVVVNDEIVIRPMMYVALSYDHRLIDGKEAVLFLVHIKESLEDPARLLLDL